MWKLARPSDVRQPESSSDSPFQPWQLRDRYVGYLAKKLELSSGQVASISQIVAESQHRTKLLFELIGPDMREEMRQVRDSIRAVLTTDQQREFDEIQKRHGRHRKESEPETEEGSRQRDKDDSGKDAQNIRFPGSKRKCDNRWLFEEIPWACAAGKTFSG